MTDTKISVNPITQDMFPGAWIEPRWSRYDEMKSCPFYAMRLALGADIIDSPRGKKDFVSIQFEGTEFVMHRDNFNSASTLKDIFLNSYLKPKGYASINRYNHPELIIDGIKFLEEQIEYKLDVPKDKVKMIWIRPDVGACGYYRSYLPSKYMKENFQHTFYVENQDFLNLASLGWFDATVMHRTPPVQLLSVFQNLKSCGKFMVYEFDDDLFNVPEWNLNHKSIDIESQERARSCIRMADMVVGSTDALKEISDRPEISFTGPNLIDMIQVGPKLQCSRRVDIELKGYKPSYKKEGVVEFLGPGKRKTQDDVNSRYNPVRILWTGSNTHDKDLDVMVKVVRKMIDKYGVSVRFLFFGYCPPQFLVNRVSSGNSEGRLAIKDEFAHALSYISPVQMNKYYESIRTIDPDLAVCPLNDHVFNLSKSNLKVLEMSAFGIPCIASDIGPYRFLNDHKGCGFVVKDNDSVNSWIDTIEMAVMQHDLRQKVSCNARSMVENYWSWNTDNENRRKWDKVFNTIYRMRTNKE